MTIEERALALAGRWKTLFPKPVDPLVEVCADMGLGASVTAADDLRTALAARGLKLVEVGDAD